ncbi:hypothetical protein [Pseudomonas sp. GZJR-8]|uniref:hypothetical protein n=1 Tax=Pseudomonas sp. GZJR-8 TaxID=1395925 RepID=UPI0011B06F29|nr:hypothetical protein [Pseudomonas sp. GZJR-8]
MSRTNSLLMLLYCALLFSAGIVFGFVFSSNGQVGFVNFLNALSSLATVGAALTAIYALRAWYPQFKHSEKFALIKTFQATVGNDSDIRQFLFDCKEVFRQVIEADIRGKPPVKETFPNSALQQWWQHFGVIQSAWENMNNLLSAEEQSVFSTNPKQVELKISDLLEKMMDIAYEPNLDRISLIQLTKCGGYGAEEVVSEFLKLNSESRLLLKKLAS